MVQADGMRVERDKVSKANMMGNRNEMRTPNGHLQ